MKMAKFKIALHLHRAKAASEVALMQGQSYLFFFFFLMLVQFYLSLHCILAHNMEPNMEYVAWLSKYAIREMGIFASEHRN